MFCAFCKKNSVPNIGGYPVCIDYRAWYEGRNYELAQVSKMFILRRVRVKFYKILMLSSRQNNQIQEFVPFLCHYSSFRL